MSGLSAVKNGASTEASTPLRAQLIGLADAARKTPRTPEGRVRLRALNSVVVYMWETESEDLRQHNFDHALALLDILRAVSRDPAGLRSEEHTSELQSRQ